MSSRALLLLLPCVAVARNSLARTPPMGWMSWEIFRCESDCAAHPDTCISEALYRAQADALRDGGYIAAGYDGIHMDDCWEATDPPRDAATGELYANTSRFPSGMAALGEYVHAAGARFGLYTAESASTCGGYPGSAGHEALDAATFAKWGVDYLKVDGCGPQDYYAHGYRAMGAALEGSGRDVVYSCSWPAYLAANESDKPFGEFVMDGCNLWRNWDDIQCTWESLSSIIDYFGDNGEALAPAAGPGHWHDMDMLLVGAGCVAPAEERTQMAIWAICASPLIMGNDLRNVSAASRDVLLNADAIAVSQDALGQMGVRVTNSSAAPTQLWARNLAGGAVAVALYNKGEAPVAPPIAPCDAATPWNRTARGYFEACGGADGDLRAFAGLSVAEAEAECCADAECAGFSYALDGSGAGYFKRDAACGFVASDGYDGYTKPGVVPDARGGAAADIAVDFAALHLFGEVDVYDIWARRSLGTFEGGYTAEAVAFHDSAFLRLTEI